MFFNTFMTEFSTGSYVIGCQATGEAIVMMHKEILMYISILQSKIILIHTLQKTIFMQIFSVQENWLPLQEQRCIFRTRVAKTGNISFRTKD